MVWFGLGWFGYLNEGAPKAIKSSFSKRLPLFMPMSPLHIFEKGGRDDYLHYKQED